MNDIIVRIVKFKAMRVAYYPAISKTPEEDALKKIRVWGEPKGLYSNPTKYYHFG